jgi:hypothetical protein
MAMTEKSESSEVSSSEVSPYLTRARESSGRGKQERALDQLWHRERRPPRGRLTPESAHAQEAALHAQPR